MKIRKQKKFLSIIGLLTGVLVIAGVYGAYANTNSLWPFSAKHTPAIDAPTDTVDDTPTNPSKDSPSKIPVGNDTPSDTPTNPDSLPITITSANQLDGNLVVRTLIEKISSQGACKLTLQQGERSVTRSSGIQALSSSSTCQGFSVPLSELSAGDWKLTVEVTIGHATGNASQTIQVN